MVRSATLLVVCAILFTFASSAHAQYKGKPRPHDNAGAGGRRPAVSPYMNLLNNTNGVATNYQSLVKPQLEQNNFNARSSSAIRGLQRQAAASGSHAAPTRSASTHEGNVKMRGTGHSHVREGYSHYYPQLGR
jgi:hypothetical protein